MRKLRDMLRLRAGGMSKRQIAASLSIGPTAAGDCLRRVRSVGLSWPLSEDLRDEALERCMLDRCELLTSGLVDGKIDHLLGCLLLGNVAEILPPLAHLVGVEKSKPGN